MQPLTLTVPATLHAAGVQALSAGLEAARTASVVVLAGEPGRFCTGMDFDEVTGGDTAAKLGRFAQLLAAFSHCPRPTLAVIDGPALGGGLGLAALCDYVIATERATFALPEALYGLAPAIIRPALCTRLSPHHLRMLVLTGYARDAREALRLNLCDEVVAVDALARTQKTVIRLLARARTTSVMALRRWHDFGAELAAGVEETATALANPEVLAALRAEVPWQT
jgi:enoyl-CoA hydratase/carnithine racemase